LPENATKELDQHFSLVMFSWSYYKLLLSGTEDGYFHAPVAVKPGIDEGFLV